MNTKAFILLSLLLLTISIVYGNILLNKFKQLENVLKQIRSLKAKFNSQINHEKFGDSYNIESMMHNLSIRFSFITILYFLLNFIALFCWNNVVSFVFFSNFIFIYWGFRFSDKFNSPFAQRFISINPSLATNYQFKVYLSYSSVRTPFWENFIDNYLSTALELHNIGYYHYKKDSPGLNHYDTDFINELIDDNLADSDIFIRFYNCEVAPKWHLTNQNPFNDNPDYYWYEHENSHNFYNRFNRFIICHSDCLPNSSDVKIICINKTDDLNMAARKIIEELQFANSFLKRKKVISSAEANLD